MLVECLFFTLGQTKFYLGIRSQGHGKFLAKSDIKAYLPEQSFFQNVTEIPKAFCGSLPKRACEEDIGGGIEGGAETVAG